MTNQAFIYPDPDQLGYNVHLCIKEIGLSTDQEIERHNNPAKFNPVIFSSIAKYSCIEFIDNNNLERIFINIPSDCIFISKIL
jgi:hypothetical protein